jgi:CheY-like chemotaxis protein
MSEAVAARAFEPFYTTKEVGKGSGLGLAQVYGVARQSGGGLRIRSAPGDGTTIELYLPRSLAETPATSEPRADARLRAIDTHATLLVVDDQEDVREVAVAQLEALGYRVVQAASGHLALDLVQRGQAIDLLIADYAMPGMSGIELARAMRERFPELPVLLVTGYVEARQLDEQLGQARLMKKPYRMAELAQAVESLLRPRPRIEPARNIVALRAGEE